MLYGFTGPSRSGKTTLAKGIAEDLGIHFHATTTTATAKAHGYDPVAPMPLINRVELQHILLDAHLKEIADLPRPAIVDRTPIDHLAYLMCEIHMQSRDQLTDEAIKQVVRYQDRVFDEVPKRYDMVFFIGQLPHYEAAVDKPTDNRAYHSHYELVVEGALARLGHENGFKHGLLRVTDFETRKEVLHDVLVQRMDVIDKERKSTLHMH